MKLKSFVVITLLVLMGLTSHTWAQQSPSSQDYMQAAEDALKGNDFTTAIQDYLLAIKADPNNWQAYQNLGGCYIQLHKMDDAKAAYVQSLHINPNNPALIKFMAQVWSVAQSPSPTPVAALPTPTATPVVGYAYGTPTVAPTSTPVYVYTVVPTPRVSTTPTPVGVVVPFYEVNTPIISPLTGLPETNKPVFKGFKPYVYQTLARYNLPDQDTITFDFGGAIYYGGVQHFNDYFGSTLVSQATSHTGWEVDLGADYTLIPEFQLGLHAEGLASPVVRSELTNYSGAFVEWDSYAVGAALSGKYLLPIEKAMSLVFHVEGGFYTLVASDIKWNDGALGTINLNGSAPGGLVEVQLEAFQVADKSLALDFGLGYRFLTFNNLTGSGNFNGAAVSGALINPGNGQPAYDDYSGPRLSASVRFVH